MQMRSSFSELPHLNVKLKYCVQRSWEKLDDFFARNSNICSIRFVRLELERKKMEK